MTGLEITEVLGNLGDFLGAIAVFATIVYLSIQVRHAKQSVDANTAVLANQQKVQLAQSRQTLITTMGETSVGFLENEKVTLAIGRCLARWSDVDAEDKTLFFDIAMSRYSLNIMNGLLLREEGLVDDETLGMVAHYMVYSAASPGGGQAWWSDSQIVPPPVREYVDRRIVEIGDELLTIDQAMPYLLEMANR